MILYKSTRGYKKLYKFSEAILKGIAPDGGLFVPTKIPKLSSDDLKSLAGKSYQEICLYLTNLFETDFSKKTLKKIISKAYSTNFDHPQIAPLVYLKDNQYILELWHGPTSAFKDMALQLTTHLFLQSLRKESKKRNYLIVVATSGDTGKAALVGYKDKKGLKILVFYPYKGVSNLQELSMITQEGQNVGVYGMNGNFDDVQRSIKETFNDKKFNEKLLKEKNTVLSSANSINWGRLFPQIIYYFSSYLDLVLKKKIKTGKKVDFAVPTGNFGNILSGYYAKMMGLPIRRLICASNANNVFTQFLKTGLYDVRKRKLVKTPSPSMDILIGSNLERLLFELTKDPKKVSLWLDDLKKKKFFQADKKTTYLLKELFFSDWVSNRECLKTVDKVYKKTKYLLDPHTAVAQAAVDRYQKKYPSQTPVIICSTAHWAKFPKDVYKALTGSFFGKNDFEALLKITKFAPGAKIPKNIIGLKDKQIKHKIKCEPRAEVVEQLIWQYQLK